MCLTLGNAATIHHHTDPTERLAALPAGTRPPATTPGPSPPATKWRPIPYQPPRTVTDIHRRHGVIVLTDQYGATWTYPATGVIPTAVPDPLHLRTSTTAAGGTRRPPPLGVPLDQPRSPVIRRDHHHPPPPNIPTTPR